eukprot:25141-Rhodomonas_salina.2
MGSGGINTETGYDGTSMGCVVVRFSRSFAVVVTLFASYKAHFKVFRAFSPYFLRSKLYNAISPLF